MNGSASTTEPLAPEAGPAVAIPGKQADGAPLPPVMPEQSPDENGVYPFFFGGKITEPRLVHEEKLDFDRLFQERIRTTTLVAEIVIDVDGTVREAMIKKGINPEIDDAFLGALKKFRYEPATLDGSPVPVKYFYLYYIEPK